MQIDYIGSLHITFRVMNTKNILHTLAVFASFILLTSCGLGEKPLEGQDVFVSPTLKSSCEIDPKLFEKFLDEEVPEQIACLHKNLDNFAKYVKRDDEHYISFPELERFAKKFFPESKNLSGSLKIFFKVNSLLLNDPSDKLSVSNIAPIFRLVTLANKEAVILNKLLKEENRRDSDLWKVRQDVGNTMSEFRRLALEIMPADNRRQNDLNLHELVLDLADNLTNTDFKIETIESFFFAKRIILGGKIDSINASELRHLVNLSPEFALLAFDFLYMEDKQFASKNERLAFFSKRLEDLRPLLYTMLDDEEVFNKKQILTAAQKLELDADVLDKIEPGLDLLKEHLLEGRGSSFSYKDLNTILSYARLALEGMQLGNAFKDGGERVQMNNVDKESLAFRKEADRVICNIKTILNRAPILPSQIKLTSFLHEANKTFDLKEEDIILDAVLGIKKILVGGKETILTQKEILTIVEKAPELASVAFDVAKVTNKHFANDYEYYDFLLPRIDRLNMLTVQNYDADETLLTTEEILKLGDRFIDNKNLFQYKQTADALLAKLYKSEGERLNYGAFRSIFVDGRKALETMLYSAALYDYHKSKLQTPEVIKTAFPFVSLPAFKNIPQTNFTKLHESFNKVVLNYRFFTDDEGLQYYGYEVKRPRKGFVLASLFKYAIGRVIQSYGRKSDTGEYVGEIKDLETFMYDLKSVLEANGLWTRKYVTFSRNMLLLSDLFQYQSNGTMNVNEDELTEYVLLVFNAVEMNNSVYAKMLNICPTSPTGIDNNIGFKQDCVIKHYDRLLLDESNFKVQLPQIYKYKQNSSQQDFHSYITNLVKFTRDYGEEVPMDKREVTMVTGVLMNVESMFTRFDFNKNGQLDNNELEAAFQVYRKAIIMVALLTPSQEKYARSVFLYMVKYMKIPKPTELARFHFLENKDDITAKRLNIAVILYYIVQQANAANGGNQ